MVERVLELALQARRIALITGLIQFRRGLTIERLDALVQHAPYGAELGTISFEELLRAESTSALEIHADESSEDAVMRVFRTRPWAWLSSGFFTRNFGLPRWEAQRLLGELAERGELQRRGRTSGTRYRLAEPEAGGCISEG